VAHALTGPGHGLRGGLRLSSSSGSCGRSDRSGSGGAAGDPST
jgi:hypothetical protein